MSAGRVAPTLPRCAAWSSARQSSDAPGRPPDELLLLRLRHRRRLPGDERVLREDLRDRAVDGGLAVLEHFLGDDALDAALVDDLPLVAVHDVHHQRADLVAPRGHLGAAPAAV